MYLFVGCVHVFLLYPFSPFSKKEKKLYNIKKEVAKKVGKIQRWERVNVCDIPLPPHTPYYYTQKS